ncbi:MAG: hypothetical protein WHV63_03410 [Ignavibacteria bacterium]|jgi:hypothetical protein|nr:hypothetical protein [Ignavibacteria bacterium]
MAKQKYYVPEKEQPHFNKEKGWIEKIEFQIKPSFEISKNNSKPVFIIDVFSFREFAFFSYTIDYEVVKKKTEFFITLKGLNTENQSFPGLGKARARIEFGDLAGDYVFHFRRASGEENVFHFTIDPFKGIIQLKKEFPDKKTNRKFVQFLG